eukprot:Rhum_TRINITY_DN13757_c1_g2::Rhum_TRINITY_DN13757_c1_g2_i1::g.63092::m.63092
MSVDIAWPVAWAEGTEAALSERLGRALRGAKMDPNLIRGQFDVRGVRLGSVAPAVKIEGVQHALIDSIGVSLSMRYADVSESGFSIKIGGAEIALTGSESDDAAFAPSKLWYPFEVTLYNISLRAQATVSVSVKKRNVHSIHRPPPPSALHELQMGRLKAGRGVSHVPQGSSDAGFHGRTPSYRYPPQQFRVDATAAAGVLAGSGLGGGVGVGGQPHPNASFDVRSMSSHLRSASGATHPSTPAGFSPPLTQHLLNEVGRASGGGGVGVGEGSIGVGGGGGSVSGGASFHQQHGGKRQGGGFGLAYASRRMHYRPRGGTGTAGTGRVSPSQGPLTPSQGSQANGATFRGLVAAPSMLSLEGGASVNSYAGGGGTVPASGGGGGASLSSPSNSVTNTGDRDGIKSPNFRTSGRGGGGSGVGEAAEPDARPQSDTGVTVQLVFPTTPDVDFSLRTNFNSLRGADAQTQRIMKALLKPKLDLLLRGLVISLPEARVELGPDRPLKGDPSPFGDGPAAPSDDVSEPQQY